MYVNVSFAKFIDLLLSLLKLKLNFYPPKLPAPIPFLLGEDEQTKHMKLNPIMENHLSELFFT
jgi:hypothetical protein